MTSLPVATFRGNTSIQTFNEFKYWTGLTTITAGSSTSALGAFGGCTALTSIEIPEGVTTIGAYAFYNNTLLNRIVIPESVTTIGTYAFANCTGITGNLIIPDTVTSIGASFVNNCTNIDYLEINTTDTLNDTVFQGTYKTNSTLVTKGSISRTVLGVIYLGWENIIIHGDLTLGGYPFNYSNKTKTIRIKGKYVGSSANTGLIYVRDGGVQLEFIELMGIVSTGRLVYNNTSSATNTTRKSTGDYWHFGASSVIPAKHIAGIAQHWNKTNKVWVGDGTSKAADQAVFDLYSADTNWSAYCGSVVPGAGKVDLWWNYNGEYKWYYVFDTLTNCTNTNPDAWPHITRGESYQTTIVPDEGYAIFDGNGNLLSGASLSIEILDTDTNSQTYDTYITSPYPTTYDSDTGIISIKIPSVTGNIKITAVAVQNS